MSNPVGTVDPGSWGPGVPTTSSDLTNVIQTVFTVAYSIAGVISFGYLVYGGYKIIMSTGDPQKMKEGQNTVAYALIGLVLVVSTAVIFNFVAEKLGIGSLIGNLDLPTS
jgi:hypothetical protein